MGTVNRRILSTETSVKIKNNMVRTTWILKAGINKFAKHLTGNHFYKTRFIPSRFCTFAMIEHWDANSNSHPNCNKSNLKFKAYMMDRSEHTASGKRNDSSSLSALIWRFPLSHRGTPSHHPFLDGDFPWNQPSSDKGVPHDLGKLHMPCQDFSSPSGPCGLVNQTPMSLSNNHG